MSIVARIATLAMRRPNAFRVESDRRYGRLDLTSSTTAAVSASSRGPSSRTDRDTPRSYLSDNLDNAVRPVVKRMLGDDAAPQLGPDGCANVRRCRPHFEQGPGQGTDVTRGHKKVQRQAGQERRERGIGRDDRARRRRRLVDGLVESRTRTRLVSADDEVDVLEPLGDAQPRQGRLEPNT